VLAHAASQSRGELFLLGLQLLTLLSQLAQTLQLWFQTILVHECYSWPLGLVELDCRDAGGLNDGPSGHSRGREWSRPVADRDDGPGPAGGWRLCPFWTSL
jgi:hypothetical protein